MERIAERGPVFVGLNVTVTLQAFPASTIAPHVVASEKSPGSFPTMAVPLMCSGDVPLLVSLAFSEWVPNLMVCTPKGSLIGISFTVPFETEIVAANDLVGSASEVAVSFTVLETGKTEGAM